MTPIGYVECRQRYRYEAARQASIAPDNEAWIRLDDDSDLRAGLRGLDDFERIWVIYELHLNETWHPLVEPPRESTGKLGVFATRSPHRPNRIGLSCVSLFSIDGGILYVGQHDLLNGTPVLDIKPYLPYADAFPNARAGWVDACEEQIYELDLSAVRTQIEWVAAHAGWDLENFLAVQLRSDPTDAKRKRIVETEAGYRIAFRTWRVDYRLAGAAPRIEVLAVSSGYTTAELAPETEDEYADKAVHRAFVETFAR